MAYPKNYTITWDGNETVSASSGADFDWTSTSTDLVPDEPFYDILEDGPWSPLYEWEDYVGLMHAVLAMELGLDEEDI